MKVEFLGLDKTGLQGEQRIGISAPRPSGDRTTTLAPVPAKVTRSSSATGHHPAMAEINASGAVLASMASWAFQRVSVRIRAAVGPAKELASSSARRRSPTSTSASTTGVRTSARATGSATWSATVLARSRSPARIQARRWSARRSARWTSSGRRPLLRRCHGRRRRPAFPRRGIGLRLDHRVAARAIASSTSTRSLAMVMAATTPSARSICPNSTNA